VKLTFWPSRKSSNRVPVHAEVEPVVVDGDPDALRRVVINLVNNAVRYAATGVEVTSTYLRAIWDRYELYAGPVGVTNPLTAANLADGLAFLGTRSQGGAVDLRV